MVYIYSYENDVVLQESRASNLSIQINANLINSFLKNKYLKIFQSDRAYKLYIDKDFDFPEEGYLIAIPNQRLKYVVILFGASSQLDKLEDIISIIIGNLYEPEQTFNPLSIKEDIKYRIYDSVKRQYGFVSDRSYEDRFNGFRKSLKNIQIFLNQ